MVISVTIGGRDVVYIRQHQSSPLSLSDIRSYVKDIGDDRFLESKGHLSAGPLKYKDKVCVICISFVCVVLLRRFNFLASTVFNFHIIDLLNLLLF